VSVTVTLGFRDTVRVRVKVRVSFSLYINHSSQKFIA